MKGIMVKSRITLFIAILMVIVQLIGSFSFIFAEELLPEIEQTVIEPIVEEGVIQEEQEHLDSSSEEIIEEVGEITEVEELDDEIIEEPIVEEGANEEEIKQLDESLEETLEEEQISKEEIEAEQPEEDDLETENTEDINTEEIRTVTSEPNIERINITISSDTGGINFYEGDIITKNNIEVRVYTTEGEVFLVDDYTFSPLVPLTLYDTKLSVYYQDFVVEKTIYVNKLPEYPVKYSKQPGVVGKLPVDDRYYKVGEEVTLMEPTGLYYVDGNYIIKGWLIGGKYYKGGSTLLMPKGGLFPINSYEEGKYHSITYMPDGNPSSLPIENQLYLEGDTFIIPGQGNLKNSTGDFIGWLEINSNTLYYEGYEGVMGNQDMWMVPQWEYSGPNLEDYDYIIESEGVVITRYLGLGGVVEIPNAIEEKPVIEISAGAFRNKGIVSLALPTSLQRIGSYAFSNNKIKELVFPSSLEEIDYNAFAYNEIEQLTLNTNLKEIGVESFIGNKINRLTVPNSIQVVSESSFANNNINELVLLDGVEEIGENAFGGNRISNVSFPKTLRSIGDFSFSSNNLFNIVLPESLEHIGKSAFKNNNIQFLDIPRNVLTLEAEAFGGTNKITLINILSPNLDISKDIFGFTTHENNIRELYLNHGPGTYEAKDNNPLGKWVADKENQRVTINLQVKDIGLDYQYRMTVYDEEKSLYTTILTEEGIAPRVFYPENKLRFEVYEGIPATTHRLRNIIIYENGVETQKYDTFVGGNWVQSPEILVSDIVSNEEDAEITIYLEVERIRTVNIFTKLGEEVKSDIHHLGNISYGRKSESGDYTLSKVPIRTPISYRKAIDDEYIYLEIWDYESESSNEDYKTIEVDGKLYDFKGFEVNQGSQKTMEEKNMLEIKVSGDTNIYLLYKERVEEPIPEEPENPEQPGEPEEPVTPEIIEGKIIVKYIDEKSNVIGGEQITVNEGTHTVSAGIVEGYKLIDVATKTVEITKDKTEIEVVFNYEKIIEMPPIEPEITGIVTVKYLDEDKSLLHEEVVVVKEGVHSYSAKDFDGYKLNDNKTKTVEITKEITTAEIIFKYEKIKEIVKGKIVVKYIDEQGRRLDLDELLVEEGSHTLTAKDLRGYSLDDAKTKIVEITADNNEIEVLFKYKKVENPIQEPPKDDDNEKPEPPKKPEKPEKPEDKEPEKPIEEPKPEETEPTPEPEPENKEESVEIEEPQPEPQPEPTEPIEPVKPVEPIKPVEPEEPVEVVEPIKIIETETVKEELRGKVSGKIVGVDGKAAVGVKVELHSNPRITYTDENGYYEFNEVELGNHTVIVKNPITDEIMGTGIIKVYVKSTEKITELDIREEVITEKVDLTEENLEEVVDIQLNILEVLIEDESIEEKPEPIVEEPQEKPIPIIPIAVATVGFFIVIVPPFIIIRRKPRVLVYGVANKNKAFEKIETEKADEIVVKVELEYTTKIVIKHYDIKKLEGSKLIIVNEEDKKLVELIVEATTEKSDIVINFQ